MFACSFTCIQTSELARPVFHTSKTTMAEQTPRSTGTAAEQHAERVAEIFRRMRAVGQQQQTERASGK